MANLRAEFSADSKGYEQAILDAAKSLDELPKAAQRAQLRLVEIAAKASNDSVKIRETQVLKELQAIEGLTKKSPQLFEQAEKAKTDIVKRYAQERIAVATQATEVETKGFGSLRDAAERAHGKLREVLMFSNALGSSFDVGKSEIGKFAKEAIGAFGVGGLWGLGIAAATTGVQALIDKIGEVSKASREAAEQFATALKGIVHDLAKEVDDAQAELVQKGFLQLGGTEGEYKTKLARESGAAKFESAQSVYRSRASELNELVAQRSGLERDLAGAPEAFASEDKGGNSARGFLRSQLADLAEKIKTAQGAFADAAKGLGSAYQLANPPGEYQGPPVPSFENHGLERPGRGRAGGGLEWRPVGPKETSLGGGLTEIDFDLGDIMAPNEAAQRQQGKFDAADSAAAAARAALQKQDAQAAAKIMAEAQAQALKDEANQKRMVEAGEQAFGNWATGFRKIASQKSATPQDIFGLLWNTLTGVLSAVNPIAGGGLAAAGKAIGFREGGGGRDIPQGREGYGPGVNFDARLAYFRHPDEFTWSAAGVAGAGGPDGVRAMHAAAREGRLGEGGGPTIVNYISALNPTDAAAAFKQATTPGMTQTMSNAQSGTLSRQLRQVVQPPRSK